MGGLLIFDLADSLERHWPRRGHRRPVCSYSELGAPLVGAEPFKAHCLILKNRVDDDANR